ncbi:unnamed protein product [Schistosoma curassoni]|uniref:Doublecortin domain-containing protein n=1 Tax=Schistosoma curassoni TaxID=6186 RepID=A0A183KI48_9TREM|nr:unnamed protein product [Schistosoma curassoni]
MEQVRKQLGQYVPAIRCIVSPNTGTKIESVGDIMENHRYVAVPRGEPLKLLEPSVFTDPVKALGIRSSSSQFRRQHPWCEKVVNQRNRWVEHSEELLNRPASLNPPGTEAAHTDFPIAFTSPTIEEIRIAVRQIKSGKAAGPDNIPAEALKSDIEVAAEMLHVLFKKIWEEGKAPPTDRKEGNLIKIQKKGDLSKCENYRGITLLSAPGMVFKTMLLNRINDSVDTKNRGQKTGIHVDQWCTDQTAALRIVNIIQNPYDGLQCKVVHGAQLKDVFQYWRKRHIRLKSQVGRLSDGFRRNVKVIFVYRNGDTFTPAIRVHLRPIQAMDFELIMRAIEDCVILPYGKAVRRLLLVSNRRWDSVHDIQSENV